MVDLVILQWSLNKNSKTSVVVNYACEVLDERWVDYKVLDLRNYDLEFCDGRDLEEYNSDMRKIYDEFDSCKAFIIATPVYQYSISWVVKNILDIVSEAMENKYMWIIVNAWWQLSYLAPAEMIKLLSYEVHVMTVQPTVFSWWDCFDKERNLTNDKVKKKVHDMLDNLTGIAKIESGIEQRKLEK